MMSCLKICSCKVVPSDSGGVGVGVGVDVGVGFGRCDRNTLE